MNTSKLFSLRNLALTAMSLLAMIFAMSDAKAQEGEPVLPVTIATTVDNLSPESFPLHVETNYEGGVQAADFHTNGAFEETAMQTMGQVQAVTVNGTRVRVGETGGYTDPVGNYIIIIIIYDKVNRRLDIYVRW